VRLAEQKFSRLDLCGDVPSFRTTKQLVEQSATLVCFVVAEKACDEIEQLPERTAGVVQRPQSPRNERRSARSEEVDVVALPARGSPTSRP
jgi:hypothetical protein